MTIHFNLNIKRIRFNEESRRDVRITVWGKKSPLTRRIEDDAMDISIECADRAIVFITDSAFGKPDLVDFNFIYPGSSQLDGDGYILYYEINVNEGEKIEGSPNKATLQIRSVVCLDSNEGDNSKIRLSTPSGTIFTEDGVSYNTARHIPHSIKFDTKIFLTLEEIDKITPNDHLGKIVISSSEKFLYNQIGKFECNGADYRIIYDVIPDVFDKEDNSFIKVHPLHYTDDGIRLRFISFIKLTRLVTALENLTPSRIMIMPDEWKFTSIGDSLDFWTREIDLKIPDMRPRTLLIKYNDNEYTKACSFKALPSSLGTFNIILGSCYERTNDNGCVDKAISLNDTIPDVVFLVGDQVYLDHPATGLFIDNTGKGITNNDIGTRFYQSYFETFNSIRTLMSRGAHYTISDDHDFFNNYPIVPKYLCLYTSSQMKYWINTAKTLIKTLQNPILVSTFNIGKDLSFLVADTRLECDKMKLMPDETFNQIIEWVYSLESPGILVLSQPLFLKKGSSDDYNLSDYQQYGLLVDALIRSKNDILVLGGDIHSSRYAMVRNPKNNLYEVISSPLSLVELTSDVGDVSKLKNTVAGALYGDSSEFFSSDSFNVDKVPKFFPEKGTTPIDYIKWGSTYPKNRDRTNENFCRINISKGDNEIVVEVECVMIRGRQNGVVDWECKGKDAIRLRSNRENVPKAKPNTLCC